MCLASRETGDRETPQAGKAGSCLSFLVSSLDSRSPIGSGTCPAGMTTLLCGLVYDMVLTPGDWPFDGVYAESDEVLRIHTDFWTFGSVPETDNHLALLHISLGRELQFLNFEIS